VEREKEYVNLPSISRNFLGDKGKEERGGIEEKGSTDV